MTGLEHITGSASMARPEESPFRGAPHRHPAGTVALGVFVAAVLFLRYTQPIVGTDVWWQMAYGRDLLARLSLIPDHTVYSWTPASGQSIYCAWLPQILLHLLHSGGGLTALFLLRYLVLAACVTTLIVSAHRRRVLTHPMTWLALLLAGLMFDSAAFIKPELFSLLFMALSVSTWFAIRAGGARAWRLCYLFPLYMVVWVNSHGGFIFGCAFLGIALAGEIINALRQHPAALPPGTRRHLLTALACTAATVFLTPYGWRYPVYLARLLWEGAGPLFEPVRAYDSIFSHRARGSRFIEYLVLAVSMLVALGLSGRRRQRQADWGLILPNAAFILLYARFLRTTYFWAPVFGITIIELLTRIPRQHPPPTPRRQRASRAVTMALCLLLGLDAVYKQLTRASNYGWIGFGVCGFNPVEEAEYLEARFPTLRLGNDYTSGGYLLWRLTPNRRIFIDPRAFPFKEWFPDFIAFREGRRTAEFMRRFPCDIWCVTFVEQGLVRWFAQSPDWIPVFYGASAVLFLRRDLAETHPLPPVTGPGIETIRNLHQALLVLDFAVRIADWPAAERLTTSMEQRFILPAQQRAVRGARAVLRGIQAYARQEYATAAEHLERARTAANVRVDQALGACYQHLAVENWRRNERNQALNLAQKALELMPNDALSLYNVGVIAWSLDHQPQAKTVPTTRPPRDPLASRALPDWKSALARIAASDRQGAGIPAAAVTRAKRILDGTYQGTPPLLVPAHRQPPPRKRSPEPTSTRT